MAGGSRAAPQGRCHVWGLSVVSMAPTFSILPQAALFQLTLSQAQGRSLAKNKKKGKRKVGATQVFPDTSSLGLAWAEGSPKGQA